MWMEVLVLLYFLLWLCGAVDAPLTAGEGEKSPASCSAKGLMYLLAAIAALLYLPLNFLMIPLFIIPLVALCHLSSSALPFLLYASVPVLIFFVAELCVINTWFEPYTDVAPVFYGIALPWIVGILILPFAYCFTPVPAPQNCASLGRSSLPTSPCLVYPSTAFPPSCYGARDDCA